VLAQQRYGAKITAAYVQVFASVSSDEDRRLSFKNTYSEKTFDTRRGRSVNSAVLVKGAARIT
jgi:hypothetical protein